MKDRSNPSVYRGEVINNVDPEKRGRIKVFVPGVYPDDFRDNKKALPWAEPAMPAFGGGHRNDESDKLNDETGTASQPNIGANVYLFFEKGDWCKPVYFAYTQSGKGWISEHYNQHRIQTKDVRITVDDQPTHSDSSQQFDSYNDSCVSEASQETDIPTTVELESKGNVNLKVTGNVNMKVDGNMYEHVTGNKEETIEGHYYRRLYGQMIYEHEDNYILRRNGDEEETINGSLTRDRVGSETITISSDVEITIQGVKDETINSSLTQNVGSSVTRTSDGDYSITAPQILLN